MPSSTNPYPENRSARRHSPRVAVIGGGVSGLTCARELAKTGFEPVVFEATGRLGGRCSSVKTRIGWFDDGAQVFSESSSLEAYTIQRQGMLSAIHPWTQPLGPTDIEYLGNARAREEAEAIEDTALELMGMVGVPSMAALADGIALPLDVRCNTPIDQAHRCGGHWVLRQGPLVIDEEFEYLVLAIPAPLALALAAESRSLSASLGAVRYRNRWVLLLGTERAVGLPSYRTFQGGPIERIAAMHSKPGRSPALPQRWFVEADERWSHEHRFDDPETVADLLCDNFQACARRAVTPCFLMAHPWPHAYAESPAVSTEKASHWWDGELQLGVCGDSVVGSRVDQVRRSGALLASRIHESWSSRSWRVALKAPRIPHQPAFPEHAEISSPRF